MKNSSMCSTTVRRWTPRYVRLVDDLLDISRLTRGEISLQRAHLDLSTVLEAATEIVGELIWERRHHVIITPPEGDVPLWADFQRLAQVVANLLTNAAQYTEPGGTIWVETTVANDVARLSVRDTGVGLAPDEVCEIFGMFSLSDWRWLARL